MSETAPTTEITIRNRRDGSVLYQGTHNTLRDAVVAAVAGGADLGDANLRDADLGRVKADLIAEILRLPNELEALRDALIAGRINGSTYAGPCACLAGTLAKARSISNYRGTDIEAGPVVFHADAGSPRERWFLNIRVGDTPETNQCAALALEWVDEAIAIRDNIRATAAGASA